MARTPTALVEPDLLVWARETRGLTVADAARKAGVPRLADCEAGDHPLSMAQLRQLAETYKRPLAAFLLPKPPPDLAPLQDCRAPSAAAAAAMGDIRLAHRVAAGRRAAALELIEALGEPPPTFALRLRGDADAEDAATVIRRALGVTVPEQRRWSSASAALAHWREAVEATGALVFQAPRIEPNVMSGFAIAEFPLPAVVLNAKDIEHRRIFTLMHELAHVARRQGTLCHPFTAEGTAEAYCNAVAAAVLVPMDALLAEPLVRQGPGSRDWDDEDLRRLGAQYRVSREVILRRLLAAGRTSREFYSLKHGEWAQSYSGRPKSSGDGGPPRERVILSHTGRRFAELVLSAYNQERITLCEAAGHFAAKVRWVGKIEDALVGAPRPGASR
jgi:Zn-dependent peptidase ImmA (M78 family)